MKCSEWKSVGQSIVMNYNLCLSYEWKSERFVMNLTNRMYINEWQSDNFGNEFNEKCNKGIFCNFCNEFTR